MSLAAELKNKYDTLSIVGMAKNAGKTTALNYLIEDAMDEGIVLGITSTGRDGETTDLVTGTEKPRVYLDRGTLVSVPSQLFDLADAGLEILEKTPYSTAIGSLLLCEVKEAGYVQIAGPVINSETKKLTADMLRRGCELVLIDGAIDRKSIASPDTSDAIILATGAVLSRRMDKVVDETAHVVSVYTAPQLGDCPARTAVEQNMADEKVMLIDKRGNIRKLDLLTSLGASRDIDSAIEEDTEYVYIPGAFTNSVICEINPKKLKQVSFILKDPTRFFMSSMDLKNYRRKGFKFSVLKNIEIAAITVNPWSPRGYSFENTALVEAMQKAVPGIPVVDVRM